MITANTRHTHLIFTSICSTKRKQVKKGQVVKIQLELVFCALVFRLFQNSKAAGLGLGLNLGPSLVHSKLFIPTFSWI